MNNESNKNIIIVGDSGVGKTTCFERLTVFQLKGFYKKTQRVNKRTIVGENDLKYTFYDTPSSDAKESARSKYYKIADLVVLVVSFAEKNSVLNRRRWLNEIKRYNEKVRVIILMNKYESDDTEYHLMEKHDIFYFSAKTCYNIKILYDGIKRILE